MSIDYSQNVRRIHAIQSVLKIYFETGEGLTKKGAHIYRLELQKSMKSEWDAGRSIPKRGM